MLAPTQQYLRDLTAYAYPTAEILADDPGRFRRKWIARVANPLPEVDELRSALRNLEATAIKVIEDAYGEAGRVATNLPTALGVRATERHLVIELTCPSPESAVGDSAAIATWTILRGVDSLWKIEELEGIPKEHWFVLG